MGWDHYSTRRRRARRRGFLFPALVVFGLALIFTHSITPFLPILLLLLVILPMTHSNRERGYGIHERYNDFEKPKHDFDDKPKREPHYALGDDGELVELAEDQPSSEPDDDEKTLYI